MMSCTWLISRLPPFKTLTLTPTAPLSRIRVSRPSLLCTISSPAISEPESTASSHGEIVSSRPQWKAVIDLKWIRDNKDLVATNIRNRNSTANLDLVLALYEDFCRLKKVSGSKFYYLKNEAVLLEMALINWAISEVSRRGFTPLITPEIVRSSVVEKCGFQPRGDNTQVYSIEDSDHCLIGTAEIPVGGIHMDSILPDSSLPLKYVAYSHCFRTEAGAAGTATRGLYRVHQFSKVEMFIFCRPDESNFYHEELIRIEEDLFASLGLHFKTLDMATSDLGAPAYRKFDVEAWMPGLGRYGEISSASNCTDYQSRRLGIRCRPAPTNPSMAAAKKGKVGASSPTQFVHTLNATACAVPRMIICLLENFQQEDGSVVIPEKLRPFMGGLTAITPKLKT